MARLEVRLVNESGRTIGCGDRWATHRVRKGGALGRKRVGITMACVNEEGKVLVARRRHRIFDGVWTLSGDTHPYRCHWGKEETVLQAARRCAIDDVGVTSGDGRRLPPSPTRPGIPATQGTARTSCCT